MRRLLSIALLLLISLPLISPLFAATSASNLPICCRRDGKHHCAMTEQALLSAIGEQQVGPQLSVVHEKCPCYPSVPVAPHLDVFCRESDSGISTRLINHPVGIPQTETLFRISFDRSRQKRGPPSQQA